VDELEPEPAADVSVDVASHPTGSVIVTVGGELDMSAVGILQDKVSPLLERDPPELIVDVRELRFADSSAIALWVAWSMEAKRFELRNPSPLLRRVIASMGLSEKLGVTR
jgi:anti-anti-sigma factor